MQTMRHLKNTILFSIRSIFAVLVFACAAFPVSAASNSEDGYLKIKSSLIYNFLKLTQWPDTKKSQENEEADPEDAKIEQSPETLNVCLLGGDPFKGVLGLLSGHTAQQKILLIEERKNPYFVNGCNLAFINKAEAKNLDDILRSLNEKPILTVSDIPGFAQRGGMVELAQNKKKQIYLDMNVKAIEKSNLRIKEDFLRMAGIVWLK